MRKLFFYKYMRSILGLLLASLFFINPCFWDNTWDNLEWTIEEPKCLENKYDLIWNFDSKVNTNLIFSIKNKIASDNKSIDVSYDIIRNWKTISEKKWEKFNILFSEPWTLLINATVKEIDSSCIYSIQKDMHIFSKIISYISDSKNINLSFDQDFKKNNILFNKIILDSKNTSSTQEQFLSLITENLSLFQDSDMLIINSENYLEILQWFDKLSSLYNINFPNKKIFIVTDSNFILSKKLLSNYINSLNVNVFTFSPLNLLNFLNYISTWKSSTDLINNKTYNINQISFTDDSTSWLFLTNFTNKLIVSGFPIGILWIIFSIGVSVTLINFIRQFIGVSIFSLYYPIFAALSIYLFSLNLTMILFLSSILSIFIIKRIFKRIHFLLNTKLALFFIFYLIFSIIIIWIFNIYNLIDFNDLKSNLVLFPFVITPMIAYKLFADERKVFSISFMIYLVEFLFVSGVSYFTIKSSFIQNIFIAYTELLILLFFINLLIWRFTWLQLLEYIRFLPLIKKHFQEE